MSQNRSYKTKIQLAPRTIGILEHWNDGIMFSDKEENTESVMGIIAIDGKIIKRIISF